MYVFGNNELFFLQAEKQEHCFKQKFGGMAKSAICEESDLALHCFPTVQVSQKNCYLLLFLGVKPILIRNPYDP